MALLRKLFFRKPPDGLLEICERVYGAFCSCSLFIWINSLFLFGGDFMNLKIQSFLIWFLCE